MKEIIFAILILFLSVKGWAYEVSLVNEEQEPQSQVQSDSLENQTVQEDKKEQDSSQDDVKDDHLKQMNDFIEKEDEKLKSIKLLNLDLQQADLEFKKKEIEQKISQLNKAGGGMVQSLPEGPIELKSNKPTIKLVSIFENSILKKAVLNINGTNIDINEGQQLQDLTVKSISSEAVIVEYSDGQTQELRML